MLVTLLRRSFGDHPQVDALAGRLAELPPEEAVEAAMAARSLADLLQAYPPAAG